MAPEPFPLGRPGDVFVGRVAELRRLSEIWAEVERGTARVVAVAGEPGIGKTSLARQVARHADERGALVLYGGCDEDLRAPYQPFIEVMRTWATDHSAQLTRLGGSAGRLARIVPEVSALAAGLDYRPTSDPEVERLLLFEAVVDLLSAASRSTPTVVVLDDLQWAAPATMQLLGHVLRSRLPSMLFVLCYRTTEVADEPSLAGMLSDLQLLPTVTWLTLGGLDEDEVRTYLETVGGVRAGATAELGRAVHARTEGNPLFMREVLAHLLESTAAAELDLPLEVREVIERRLHRVSASARQALVAGAVAGPSFSVAVLERVRESTETADALAEGLEEATAAGLVRPGPRDTFSFSHALVRQTLYAGLNTPRRLRLHRRVAEALEDLPGPADQDRLAELARHYTMAAPLGCAGQAVRYLRGAGDNARTALAADTAIEHYQQALDLLPGIPDAAERSQHELHLLLSLGAATVSVYGLGDERATAIYDRAEELSRAVGDAGERFAALQGVFGYWVGRPDHVRAAPVADALVALADGAGRPAMALGAHAWRGTNTYLSGDRRRAADDFAIALEIYDPARTPFDLLDPGITAMVFTALIDWDAERDAAAVEHGTAVCEVARGRHPFTVAYVLAHVGKLHARLGDAAAAAELAAEARALATEHGFRQLTHQAGWVAGWATALAGRPDDGAVEIRAALDGLAECASMADASHAMVVLAEVLARAGDVDAALAVAGRTEEFIATTGERAYEAEVHRIVGELLSGTDPAEAESRLWRAVDMARAQSVPAFERRAVQTLDDRFPSERTRAAHLELEP